jgi:hypothetical protein
MTSLQANCPACGGQVNFKQGSSVVVVCEYCNSVVARTDRGLEDLGKVAEVAESASPLTLGLRGVYRGTAFELTGHTQLGHSMGGQWEEWYAAFADGRWGWLAEAQGRFYMSFRAPDSVRVPAFEQVTPGSPVREIPTPTPLLVSEKGEARYLSAEGEIPYRLTPGQTYRYADLSGQGGTFATIDYGDDPAAVYVGREVTLTDIGISATERPREREARTVAAAQLQCPQCGGPLELRAPDIAERVTCPNCGSLLDVNKGRLQYLKTLKFVGYKPEIALGSVAEFEGQQLTAIGFMTRSVEFEGTRYFWQEYLLYNPAAGFRWLVQSDGHWSYVVTVPPGEVAEVGNYAQYQGTKFKKFQEAVARVEYVAGEFYWKVTAGERVLAVDYVKAPRMLSKEVSGKFSKGDDARAMQAEEINWSLGTYVPVREVKEKFKLETLSSPTNVAPNQPFPHKSVYKLWPLLLLATLVVGVLTTMMDARRKIFEQTFNLRPQSAATPAATPNVIRLPGGGTMTVPTPVGMPAMPGATPAGAQGQQVLFTEAFEIAPRQNIAVTAHANVENSYLYVGGDLINEETGLVQQFDIPIEMYSGVEDGESWREGDNEQKEYISALPGGRYVMRLEAQWEDWKTPTAPLLQVRVEQGVTRGLNFFLALLAISLIPIIVLIRHMSFERRRWAESSFNPYDSGGSDDDDGE